jgi:hypothetical protein
VRLVSKRTYVDRRGTKRLVCKWFEGNWIMVSFMTQSQCKTVLHFDIGTKFCGLRKDGFVVLSCVHVCVSVWVFCPSSSR